jgi:hypothetical protein
MRATAAAILFLIINLIGMGLGPPIVGLASDCFAGQALPGFAVRCPIGSSDPACAAASATGMRHALVACGLVCLWAGAHFGLAGAHLKRTPA